MFYQLANHIFLKDCKKDMDSKALSLTRKSNEDTDPDSEDSTEASPKNPSKKLSRMIMHY